MTRPFRPADFAPHITAGANLAIVENRCLSRLAPAAAPIETTADRTLRFVFSDGTVDRYGDKIDPNGWALDNFIKNPVALWAHDASQPPIGRALNVGVVNGKLMGSIEFLPAEISPLADSVFQMFKSGFLNAVSVGFAAIEWTRSTDKSRPGGIDFKRQELMEISAVPVPALPSALVQAQAAGISVRAFADWADRQLSRKEESQMPREALETIRRDFGAQQLARAAPTPLPTIETGRRSATGFESFGQFLRAAVQASGSGTDVDRRLVRAPTGAGEVDPSTGGFLVPDEYESELIGSLYEEALLAPLCDRRQTDKPANAKLPAIDEKSRADGSRWGGALSYWVGEGDEPPNSLPRYREMKFAAKKLMALVVATEELVADVPLLEGHVRRAFAAEGAFKLDLAILRGTGAGTPRGILSAPGAITVPKASGQAAGTIIGENIASMWSRLPAPCRKRAVWIVNEDAEAQLEQITAAVSTSAANMYAPAGTGGNPYPLLKGRPVLIAEQASLLGTPGDIVLADLSQYILIDGGFKFDLSLDVLWTSGQAVFRFVWRGDGQPTWSTPITPYNGGSPRSPYVILGQR